MKIEFGWGHIIIVVIGLVIAFCLFVNWVLHL